MKIIKALLLLTLVMTSAGYSLAADADKEMRIGFVYISPVGDAGWTYSHDLARQELARMPGIKTYLVESVPEGADAERVILNMSRKGYDVVITTSFGFMESTLKVASQFPNITYLHCSGYKTAENVSNYFGRMYQARYLSGMVAGSMTNSNIIGYVAAFPIPEVVRGINAFTLGVKAVNPKAEVRVVWTKTWYDPVTEKEAAKSLVSVGADVLAQHQDSAGTQEAANEKKVYSVGYNADMSQFAPESHLVAAVWNWAPFYKNMIEKVRAGTWESGSYWEGIETGIVGLSDFGPMIPENVRKTVLDRKQEIIEGKFVVFSGPIQDQSGTERIAEGQVPTDKELIEMNWFVQGVVGSTQ